MESIKPGSLLRVNWVEDPDEISDWGGDMTYFDASSEEKNIDNIVMLIEWMPYISNSKNVISFKCLYKNKIYYSSTYGLVEIIDYEI